MKSKSLLFASVIGLCLTSCATGVKHDISEYFLHTDYKVGGYRILQLTDIHLGDKDYQDLHFKFMDLTIKDANPDMIVVTGDLFTFASKSTAKRLFNFLDSYGVPWTITFGNHDEQCYFSVDWMTGYLNTYGKNCLFKDIQDDDIHGNCNFTINLMNGSEVFEQVVIIDSNRYSYGISSGYDYFKKDQINWYSEMVDYSTSTWGVGGQPVHSVMFYHIPLPEINDAWEKGTKLYDEGEKREKSCPPDVNSGFFKVIKEKGSTDGMYFGHDHVNNFIVEYEGIDFGYGIHSTNRIYYDEDMIGGRVVVINDDHSLSYEHIYHTYEEVK